MLGYGWIATIIIGAIAGWLTEKIMKIDLGTIKSCGLGILGGVLGGAVLSLVNGSSEVGGWITGVLVSVIGACVIVWVYKKIKKL